MESNRDKDNTNNEQFYIRRTLQNTNTVCSRSSRCSMCSEPSQKKTATLKAVSAYHCLPVPTTSSTLSSTSSSCCKSRSKMSSSSLLSSLFYSSSKSSSPRLWLLSYYLLMVLMVVMQCDAAAVVDNVAVDIENADHYLTQFGYYKHLHHHKTQEGAQMATDDVDLTLTEDKINNGEFTSEHSIEDDSVTSNTEKHTESERHQAIKRLQRFFHLPKTGQLDIGTKKVLTAARCGDVDVGTDEEEEETESERRDDEEERKEGRREKRYAIRRYQDGRLARWEQGQLTWRITRPTRQIEESVQRDIMRKALAVWAKYVPINFVEDRGTDVPDIEIQFARGEHGPRPDNVFDGSPKNAANVLAHAFHPGRDPKGFAGDVHFDDDDDWTDLEFLMIVAVHELGHSMGLDHSTDNRAVMFAVYQKTNELYQDDINGINELYGEISRGGTFKPPEVTSRPRYVTRRPDTRYQTERPDTRYQTQRPDSRYRTNRPDTRYNTERPYPGYRTERPDPRYQTDRPDPRYRTNRPDPRYRTVKPDTRYRTERPYPPYRTDRPDPRYRTERPDSRYWTDRPDYRTIAPYYTVRPQWVTSPPTPDADMCADLYVDAIFEDHTAVLGHVFVAISGDHVNKITSHGNIIESTPLKSMYPDVPESPDVAFSIKETNTVYFIKDEKMWAYNGKQLQEGYPVSLGHLKFPERPKFAVHLPDGTGNTRLLLFGDTTWWTFDVDRLTQVRHDSLSAFSPDLPPGIVFAATWADKYLYAVTKDSYVIMDLERRHITHDKPILGKPKWMLGLCGNGSRASTSFSITSLLATITLAGVIKSFLL